MMIISVIINWQPCVGSFGTFKSFGWFKLQPHGWKTFSKPDEDDEDDDDDDDGDSDDDDDGDGDNSDDDDNDETASVQWLGPDKSAPDWNWL